MADDLGEVRVKVEEEGADDAAESIADATGESDGQQGGGGGISGLLGGISTKLAGILGFAAFLASLKPIQELLSGLQRLFSVAILPLVGLLTTFLRPVLQKLLRFIGNLDFNRIVESLNRNLKSVVDDLAVQLGNEVQSRIPGAGGGTAETAFRETGEAFVDAGTNPLGGGGALLSNLNLNITGFKEQSNTSLESNAASSNSKVVQDEGVGSE